MKVAAPNPRGPSWTAFTAAERWARFWAPKPSYIQRRKLRQLQAEAPNAFDALPPDVRGLIAIEPPKRRTDGRALRAALSRTDLDERTREILKARLSGRSLSQVARMFGITRQRISQIQASALS